MIVKSDILKEKRKLKKEIKKILEIRRKRPKFVRQESWRYIRLKENWRRPRGKDSRMRLQKSGSPPLVSIGYGSPKKYRGLHPCGLKEKIIHNINQLNELDPKIYAIRISSKVGKKKRIEIYEKAISNGFKVLNPPILEKLTKEE